MNHTLLCLFIVLQFSTLIQAMDTSPQPTPYEASSEQIPDYYYTDTVVIGCFDCLVLAQKVYSFFPATNSLSHLFTEIRTATQQSTLIAQAYKQSTAKEKTD